ncbi:hypothetical protein P7M10_23350 [Vibrio parahaemolyticus]|nr:hypothetical protein [Vibrio parahaemolyticus]HBC3480970.1 hypothetical protein [Vibrio parahaemolyticus]
MFVHVIRKMGALSDTLASLSIIAAAGLFIFDYIDSQSTELQATIVTSSSNSVTLFVSNVAGRDVVIKNASISIPDLEINSHINLKNSERMVKAGDTIMIESLDSKLHTSVLMEEVAKYDSGILPGAPCFLEISFVNVLGDSFLQKFEHDCFAESFKANKLLKSDS